MPRPRLRSPTFALFLGLVLALLGAAPDDPPGETFHDGEVSVFLDMTDEEISPRENGNPVRTLRMRADAWHQEEETRRRRAAALERLEDGILLLPSRPGPKAEDQPRFDQDAAFFYFTGLEDTPGAILALDGPRGEALLFVAPPPLSFGRPVPGLGPEPGGASAQRLGFDAVRPTDDFVPWLEARLVADPAPLYVDEPRRPEVTGAPPGMPPLAGPVALWRRALEETFPGAQIESAAEILVELRWTKSPREVALLRRNARATAGALRAAAGRIGPGTTQRQAEGAVVAACLEAGAQGPSFWPWTMSGPNAAVDRLVRAFYDDEHLDRAMEAGELVRVDIGCAGGGYGADVGRTLPVSGRFDRVQAEVWDLLVEGYLAGLDAIAPDVGLDEVRAASRARIRDLAPGLESEAAREAARLLDDDGAWHAHGVGIESGEEALPVLREGSVLAYEPMVEVKGDAFYLEDMIVVTADGHEVLSAGLPYRSDEIAELMEGGAGGAGGR